MSMKIAGFVLRTTWLYRLSGWFGPTHRPLAAAVHGLQSLERLGPAARIAADAAAEFPRTIPRAMGKQVSG